jgi:hypothetical protein
MPTESESQVSSNGSSSTVTVTVRETGGGPGGNLRYADIFLHIEPSGLVPDGRANPSPSPTAYDPGGITVWWQDVEFMKGDDPPKSVKLKVKRKLMPRLLASNRVHVLVAFEHLPAVHVHHHWISGKKGKHSSVVTT